VFRKRRYLAEIGRRGGIRSRRVLDPETARHMVRIREARRAARDAVAGARARHAAGAPADTSAAAQAVQDALLKRASPVDKLTQVARLSRMVDLLSIEGLRQRHPEADAAAIQRRRAELRLGRDLAARLDRARHA
jgi:hypothetical protein